MPRYRIHRLKDAPGEAFRWAAHTGGLAVLKPRDYQEGDEIVASNPYAAWKLAASRDTPIRPGDVLQNIEADAVHSDLCIYKYIGFERAQWLVPETSPLSSVVSDPPPSVRDHKEAVQG